MPLLTPEHQRTLRDLLRDAFTLADLDQLTTIRLSTPLTDTAGLNQPLPDIAFALVQWAEKHGRTRDLIRAVRDERPDNLAVVAACDALLAAAPADAPPDPKDAVWSIRQVGELLRMQPARDAIGRYEGSFQDAADHIRGLGRFKKLHDNFQVAEGAVKVVMSELRRLRAPADGGAERIGFDDDLADAADVLTVELQKVADYADAAGFTAAAVVWRRPVARAVEDLSKAVAAASGAAVDRVALRVQNLVGTELPRLNQKIVELARLLSLRAVADGLREVHAGAVAGRMFDTDSDRWLKRFEKGVTAVLRFDGALEVLLENHNRLQGVDGILGLLGTTRTPDVAAVANSWVDVTDLVADLRPPHPPDWVRPLTDLAAAVTTALDPPPTDPAAVRAVQKTVNQFRLKMDEAFNRTDVDLLALCGELQTLGKELRAALQELQDV